MSGRTIEPMRVNLPEEKADARPVIRNAAFGKVEPRYGRTAIGAGGSGVFGTYVLIEGGRKKDLALIFEGFEVDHCCLYQGEAADEFALQAPYLAKVDPDSDFADWLVDDAWGKGYVVFLRSNADMDALRSQFRKFTQLYDPGNERWYHFRFYAPEVVRRTLPALPPEDFSRISNGIAAFVTESADARSVYVI